MNHKQSSPHLFSFLPLGGVGGGIILSFFTLQAHAGDSILYERAQLCQPATRFAREQIQTPALRHLLRVPSLSEISVSGENAPSATARIPQLGTGGHDFRVEAQSLQHLGRNSLVWGNASYENGRKYDVVWNETSDFQELYPYMMGDSRGGNLKYEQYILNGGYSAAYNRWHYGVEMGYRALSEYRDRDPRPDNTVADLYARLGAGYSVANGYAIALTLDAGKYKQTNELAYYNELGAQKEFQLTGIGNDFARFSGLSNNCFFKGYNIGTGLSLAPTDGEGWTATASYMFIRREKILTDLNRLPLNRLDMNRISASAGLTRNRYGFRLKGEYLGRKGNDNLFGDPSGSIYPQIGTKEQYSGSVASLCADGYYMIKTPRGWEWDIEPRAEYSSVKNKHKDSGNRFDSDDMVLGIRGGMNYIFGKNMIGAMAKAWHRFNMKQKTALYSCCDESLYAALQQAGDYFAKGETSFGISCEYSRRVWGNKALSLGMAWQHGIYLGNKTDNRYEAKIVFTI